MDLFEYAWKESGLLVISDLHYKVNQSQVKKIFRKICIEDYSLEQWNDVLMYILGNKRFTKLQSMTEVYEFLKMDV